MCRSISLTGKNRESSEGQQQCRQGKEDFCRDIAAFGQGRAGYDGESLGVGAEPAEGERRHTQKIFWEERQSASGEIVDAAGHFHKHHDTAIDSPGERKQIFQILAENAEENQISTQLCDGFESIENTGIYDLK